MPFVRAEIFKKDWMDFDSSICERYRMIGTCWTIQTEVAHTHTQSNKYLSRRERMDTVDVARWRIARQLEWKLFLAPFLGFHRQYTQVSGLSFSLSLWVYLRNFFFRGYANEVDRNSCKRNLYISGGGTEMIQRGTWGSAVNSTSICCWSSFFSNWENFTEETIRKKTINTRGKR
jgi:hypothetical protein